MLDVVRHWLAAFISPELVDQRNKAERQANMDALTGIANRRAFDLALPSAEADHNVAIVLFDINNFGRLNKARGHALGDLILEAFAALLENICELYPKARVFRIGGDEFAIITPRVCAYTLRAQVEGTFTPNCGTIDVTVSGTIGNTLAEADLGLQVRKERHKATFH